MAVGPVRPMNICKINTVVFERYWFNVIYAYLEWYVVSLSSSIYPYFERYLLLTLSHLVLTCQVPISIRCGTPRCRAYGELLAFWRWLCFGSSAAGIETKPVLVDQLFVLQSPLVFGLTKFCRTTSWLVVLVVLVRVSESQEWLFAILYFWWSIHTPILEICGNDWWNSCVPVCTYSCSYVFAQV